MQFISILLWLVCGLFILRFRGRRALLCVFLLSWSMICEIIQMSMKRDVKEGFLSKFDLILFEVSGSVTYVLYYMNCLIGAMDIAKIEMLRSNIKYIGMLYCFLVGFQMLMEAVFFENFMIFIFKASTFQLKICIGLEMGVDLICIALLFNIMRKEFTELKQLNRTKDANFGLQVASGTTRGLFTSGGDRMKSNSLESSKDEDGDVPTKMYNERYEFDMQEEDDEESEENEMLKNVKSL